MPSLPAIAGIRAMTGLPTLSAATATARSLRLALGLPPLVLHEPEAVAASPLRTS
jgi:hypothetical protein